MVDRAASPTDKEHGHDRADRGRALPTVTRLPAGDVRRLDPYGFLAVLGKRVIHPGGRRSTQQLLELASLAAGQQVLDVGCGVTTTTTTTIQAANGSTPR
jgi:hypothetical protein